MRLSNFFSGRRASDKLQQRNLQRRRLSLEPLEDRRLLTVILGYTGVGNKLGLTVGVAPPAGATVNISEADYVAFGGADTLTITVSDGFGVSSPAIPGLLDYPVAGKADINLTAVNTISDLDVALPGYALTFGTTAAPAVTAPIYNYHGGLSRILVTDAASITVNGGIDTSRTNGKVNLVSTTGAVTVNDNAIINSGTGNIELAAWGGTGLTINAGARVTSASPITLAGNAVSIDTSANPAVIGGQHVVATTPSRSLALPVPPLAAAVTPRGVAVDPSGNVYVGDTTNNSVSEYSSSGTLIRTIALPAGATPIALVVDQTDGSLYVADHAAGHNAVYKYSNSGALLNTISTANPPVALAIGTLDDLYILDDPIGPFLNGVPYISTLYEYANTGVLLNSVVVNVTFSPPPSPPNPPGTDPGSVALAADQNGGNVYVANFALGTVTGYTAALGASGFAAAPFGGATSGALAVDQTIGLPTSGHVFVAQGGGAAGVAGTVREFSTAGVLVRTVTLPAAPTAAFGADAMAFDKNDNLFVADYGNKLVSEITPYIALTPAAAGPDAVLTDPTWAGAAPAAGLAYDPVSGNLYLAEGVTGVAPYLIGKVSVFQPVALPGSVDISPLPGTAAIVVGPAGSFLTNAELAQIQPSATGNIIIGTLEALSTPITFSGAKVTTTGATLVAYAASIVLDDTGGATALDVTGGSISLTAGVGGIVAKNANDTVAEIHTTGATVTMDTTGAIGTAANRIQFADNPDLHEQNVVIGATTPPTSVYLDGLGNLTLGSVIVSGAAAPIDVTARTNLVVAPGARIDGGASTISLGADLKADGTGDDGVGTLYIRAAPW